MAEPTGRPEQQAPKAKQAASGPPAARRPSAAAPQQVEVEDANAMVCYANFCRVTGTPEELLIDFGLSLQPFGAPSQPVVITQRIVTSFYTAKRMLRVLELTLQRHEAVFGALEIDVRKRARRT